MSGALAWLSPATTAYLGALRENNDRAWFTAHKSDYEAHLKYPAEQFASALAGELAAQSGTPHEYRIFRIHRDVRFAKGKTPYNAHLHISLSPDGGCREGGPAWMFGLDPDGLTLGAGIFVFSPAQLTQWREWCASEEGAAIEAMLAKLTISGARLSEPELKRVPAPWNAEHPREAQLRRKGLSAWLDQRDPSIAFGAKGPARCAAELMKLRALFDRLALLAG
jgi:uncharacterized protein (TIGR02453 family)